MYIFQYYNMVLKTHTHTHTFVWYYVTSRDLSKRFKCRSYSRLCQTNNCSMDSSFLTFLLLKKKKEEILIWMMVHICRSYLCQKFYHTAIWKQPLEDYEFFMGFHLSIDIHWIFYKFSSNYRYPNEFVHPKDETIFEYFVLDALIHF